MVILLNSQYKKGSLIDSLNNCLNIMHDFSHKFHRDHNDTMGRINKWRKT